ncbi:hypothetical protein [Mycobacterium szulgai]|uniref:hypothetical protein n=1 Tax=Mycobacterium szulgai TaxID=1787 RepID=UPI0021F26B37|nr:hypothetical protein [Mycobacterium szulgai]MCV7076865.1 hypothetical protein [Mycobacterium szulgai]
MLRQLIDPTHGSDPYESYTQFRAPQPPDASQADDDADNGADKDLVNGTPQPLAESNVADGPPSQYVRGAVFLSALDFPTE